MTDHDLHILHVIVVFLVLFCLATVAWGQGLPVVPDPTLTPGVIASTDQALVCAWGDESYSQQHRHTSATLKAQVREEYHAASCGEIDHRLPLSLGGADELGNLWCEPDGPWGYKIKDRIEDAIWRMVCPGRTMTLAEAQEIFIGQDWRVAFCKYIGGPPCPP